MKKAIKISLLHHFLVVLVLSLPFFFTLDSKKAFSSNYKINQENIPLKRPLNLFQLEESTDTILNLVQKVGAKPTVGVKKTNLKKNETLSSALLRINFNSQNINKIINSIYNLKNGKKILSSLPAGMNIDYSNPSDLTGAALKLNYSKKKRYFCMARL